MKAQALRNASEACAKIAITSAVNENDKRASLAAKQAADLNDLDHVCSKAADKVFSKGGSFAAMEAEPKCDCAYEKILSKDAPGDDFATTCKSQLYYYKAPAQPNTEYYCP